MKTKIIKNNSGISILEVIVAILIITIGMVGVLSLVIQNIQAQYINRNILIASGLAQEGLELVRNIRDLNWLTPGNAWDKDLAPVSGQHKFVIDYRGRSSLADIAGIDAIAAILNIDNSSGFYWHGAGTDSMFKRMLTVEKITIAGAEYLLDVKCTIRWRDGAENHDYTAETYLYNWR